MAACMLIMSRGHGDKSADPTTEQQIASLKAELGDLRAQVRAQDDREPATGAADPSSSSSRN